MTIRRFFVENVGAQAVLAGDEYSHAKNVLRLQEGDEVVLLDGSGKEYDAVINKVSKGEMLCVENCTAKFVSALNRISLRMEDINKELASKA